MAWCSNKNPNGGSVYPSQFLSTSSTSHTLQCREFGSHSIGDRERKMVAGVRLGLGANGMPLKFMWFCDSEPVGTEGRILLNAGDVYLMSEKAVGFDWLTKKELTLRHAAGADKYSSVHTLKVIQDVKVGVPPHRYLLGETLGNCDGVEVRD